MSSIKVGDLVMLVGAGGEWAAVNGLCTTVLRAGPWWDEPSWELEFTEDIRAAFPAWTREASTFVARERHLRRIPPPDWNALIRDVREVEAV